MMEFIKALIEFIIHIDVHLAEIFTHYQTLSYGILFVIIFIETGLVLMPFLPGDSLLFATGALIASTHTLNIYVLMPLLILAAVLGDNCNYFIGKFIGDFVVENKFLSRFIKKDYITKTEGYFEKHGGKTIIIARFMPIVRTFAPFVAGVGEMRYRTFLAYSIGGGALWVVSMTVLGYLFGNLEFVRNNFEFVIFGIIGFSVLPIIITGVRAQFSK